MCGWNVILRASLLVFLSAKASPAAPDSNLAGPLDSLFAGIPYSSFEWLAAEGVSERAAMRVPVDLAGVKGWFQLDTGLDVTLVYGDLAEKQRWETYEGFYRVPDFRIGGMDLGPTWALPREEMGGGSESIGSLGLDVLVGRLVLIDYPGRRLSLMKPGEAPLWLLQRTTWTPAELRHAKFFLTVVLGGSTVSGLVFDTGSSAFDIVVDLEKWKDLTGLAGPDQAPLQRKVRSWGNEITAVGSPARGPLLIGSARVPQAQVFYLKEQPGLFASWPFPATGIIGSAPFRDRVVLLDLGIRPRFGLVQ